MAQNYAAMYAPSSEEAFALASLTQGVFDAKYDWTGPRRDLTWHSDAECAIEVVLRKPTEQDLRDGGRLREVAA